MACNSCAKSFTLFRKEKGCPNCGFSYCSNCLNHKIFSQKLNCEEKVCSKCKYSSNSNKKECIQPPDAYYKRIGVNNTELNDPNIGTSSNATYEIEKRFQNLKESNVTNEDIVNRLQNIKGTQPSTSDAELQSRLANLKGLPVTETLNKPLHWSPDNRSEQEQADELIKCYIEQDSIDKQYQDGFQNQLRDIESRMLKLRENTVNKSTKVTETQDDSEDEETEIKNIIEKVKVDSLLDDVDDGISLSNVNELPFCEICNEDARMRCLGCRYLFCKRCFLEHKDDDDGCNRYEPYEPPKTL